MENLKAHTDQELLNLIKVGSEPAFRELYERYWDILLDAAYKRLDYIAAAEEMVQDIFVNLYVRREELTIKTTLEGYLKNALKYKVFDAFRAQKVHQKYVDSLSFQHESGEINAEHSLQVKELMERLDRTTRNMPEKCREVFLLSRMEKLSNKSIAERLGISVSTVEKHISKAMRILKEDFKDYNLGVILLLIHLLKK